jgi:SRSO17 transposase
MTEAQLRALGPQLAAYLRAFHGAFAQERTADHLHTYCRGLLADLPRKTVEPLALHAGTPVRTLQEFLRDHLWDVTAVRAQLQGHVAARLPTLPADDLGTVGLVDETSAVKDGTKTPGVQRQYLGCVGKVDNGIVTVHLGACRGRYQTLLDADLFLPESWSDDRPRCRAAGIPDEVAHRPKWQIALEQIDRARAQGIALDWLTFDAEYGKCPGFRAGLDERQLPFVGEVPRTLACLGAGRAGRPPAAHLPSRPAEDVARSAGAFRGQSWQVLRLSRHSCEEQVWRVKAAPVWLSSASGWSAGTYWLLWASSDATGEEKFFLSNAPADASAEVLVRVAFRRACVEHSLRVCKSELGFTHFEGRSYRGLLRHLGLCLVALNFVAEHTERLRGEKCRGDGGAGVPGVGAGVPELAAAAAGDERRGVPARDHKLSPGAQQPRPRVEAKAAGGRPQPQETSPPPAQTPASLHRSFQVAEVALYC